MAFMHPKPNNGVKIMVRVRPPLPREMAFDTAVEVLSDREIVVYRPEQEFASLYDAVLGEASTQDETYTHVKAGVLASISGYNNTIIAYGQTGTGKTHTMMGEHGTGFLETDKEKQKRCFGIIPRAVMELFVFAKVLQNRENCLVNMTVSYLEIYNDRLYDLLVPYKRGSGKDPMDILKKKEILEVREDAKGNTFVPSLESVKVKNPQSVLQLIEKGNRNRAVRHTEMNINSSRSHAILQISLEQWPNNGEGGKVIKSKLNFVDLAGSERWNTKLDMQAERISELTSINSSLSALGAVVAALSEGKAHVPYRSSKLTHLLQDSLGGNCQTTVISTISPSGDAFDETVSTLKFADRASNIGNNPIINVSRDMNSVLAIKEREIQRLRQMLAQVTSSGSSEAVAAVMAEFGPPSPHKSSLAAGTETNQLQAELAEMKKALDSERALRVNLEAQLREGNISPAEPSTSIGGAVGGAGISRKTFDYLKVDTPSTSTVWGPESESSGGGGTMSPSSWAQSTHSPVRWQQHQKKKKQGKMGRADPRTGGNGYSSVPSRVITSARADPRTGGNSYASVPSRVNTGARASPHAPPKPKPGSNIEEAILAIRMRIEQLSMPPGARPPAGSPTKRANPHGRSFTSPFGRPNPSVIGGGTGSYLNSSLSSPTGPPQSWGGSSGFGRSSMTAGKLSDSPPVNLPGEGRQLHSPAQRSGGGAGWGRTSLLSGGSGGGSSGANWGRGALQTSATEVNQLISDMFSQPVSVRGGGPVAESGSRHSSEPQRTFGRSRLTPPREGESRIPSCTGKSPGGVCLGKESMIYVLGAPSNSEFANTSLEGLD